MNAATLVVRFYAGAPLIEPSTGLRLGSLCCIDYKPRAMERSKLMYLQRLADLVVEHLSLRKDKDYYMVGLFTSLEFFV